MTDDTNLTPEKVAELQRLCDEATRKGDDFSLLTLGRTGGGQP